MNSRKNISLLSILLTFALLLMSCEPEPSAGVSSIDVTPSSIQLEIGGKETLVANIKPADAPVETIIWRTSNPDVASVKDGVVIAEGTGTATVTVQTIDGSAAASCKVNVSMPSQLTAVDLGLSVKWANINVGASKPEDRGGYYAWGETNSKDPYSLANYKWCNEGSINMLTKYNGNPDYGMVDNKYILDFEDDVAYSKWGDGWRIPTDVEWKELLDNCAWEKTEKDGINGYDVLSKINGNRIFIPTAGDKSESSLLDYGVIGYYWTSVPDVTHPCYPYCFRIGEGYSGGLYAGFYRSRGLSVRPVCGVQVVGRSVTLDKSEMTLIAGSSAVKLSVSVSPVNVGVKWSSNNPEVATVDQNGNVRPIMVGAATITASAADGINSAECKVDVVNYSAEYVDLGLSVKWAAYNLGATKPEEYGGLYAWGEIETKDRFSADNYRFYQSDTISVHIDGSVDADGFKTADFDSITIFKGYTKYMPQIYANKYGFRGFYDGKSALDPEDDVAKAKLGNKWRMPTDAEWSELLKNCTWIWGSYKGVRGYKVTSKKAGYTDKWIFLPVYGANYTYAHYWSSSLNSSSPSAALYLYFSEREAEVYSYNRYYGQQVRPVSE